MKTMASFPGGNAKTALDRDVLTVAMTLVPRMYSRNRMYALFTDPDVRSARMRSALLRGAVRQLSGREGAPECVELIPHAPEASEGASVDASSGEAPRFELRYRIPSVRLARTIALGELEAIALRFLVDRAGARGLFPQLSGDDRRRLDSALRTLALGFGGACASALDSVLSPGRDGEALPGDAVSTP
jgi:hypothetical protein